jgi:hypothetical protein
MVRLKVSASIGNYTTGVTDTPQDAGYKGSVRRREVEGGGSCWRAS